MPSPFALILAGIILAACGGLPLFVLRHAPTASQRGSALLHGLAGVAGLTGALRVLTGGRIERYTLAWNLPFGPAEIGVDPLAAFFLLPVFFVSTCCALYAVGYWPAADNRQSVGRLSLFFGLLTAGTALVVVARHAVLFLMAWEVMALSCYFVLITEDRRPEVREAGILYLVAAHLGALALFALFALLKAASGSFAFPGQGSLAAGTPLAAGIFVFALLGFGLKAGLVPLHVWLPSAHASAPSHVSAFMSGVLIKTGIYGLFRVCSFFGTPPAWWGVTILLTGIVSGIIGVAFALGQHDIKRLLAYHSIENIGIITMGLGIALVGRSGHLPALVLLGSSGALLHVLNHALFKSLLFQGAGSVIHTCGTREIDRLGGLARTMPVTAACFLTGAVAICGLPPLNGFVSEWLIYLGLFTGTITGDDTTAPLLALTAPALALIGALAVACFVKVYGIAFLGAPRTEAAAAAHEGGRPLLAPMLLTALCCGFIGIVPGAIAPLLERTVFSVFPELAASGVRLADRAPLAWLTWLGVGLLIVIVMLALAYRRRLAAGPVATAETWGCGYLAPTSRMQYTASSFAEMLVGLLRSILRPHGREPVIKGLFPDESRFASHVPETVLELVFLPLMAAADERLSLVRRLQHGRLNLYILYIVITLVALLAWSHFTPHG
jgi:hydrogenase-4 component B